MFVLTHQSRTCCTLPQGSFSLLRIAGGYDLFILGEAIIWHRMKSPTDSTSGEWWLCLAGRWSKALRAKQPLGPGTITQLCSWTCSCYLVGKLLKFPLWKRKCKPFWDTKCKSLLWLILLFFRYSKPCAHHGRCADFLESSQQIVATLLSPYVL